MLKELEGKFEVRFAISYISTNDLKSALITSAMNNRQPDLVLIPSDFFGEHRSFRLTPISERLKSELPIDERAWTQSRVDGNYYGIPMYIGNHLLMFYNKSIVQTPAKTWQQLKAQSVQLSHGQRLIGWNYRELFWFIHIISAFDAYPVSQSGVTLNTAEFARALAFYGDLSRNGTISADCNYTCSSQRFIDGEFAYALNGDWAYTELKAGLGSKLGIAPLLSIDGKQIKSYYSTINLVFPGRQKAQQLSTLERAVLKTLLTEQNQMIMFEKLGLLPTTRRVREKIDLSVDPEYKEVINTLEGAIPLPSSKAMTAAWAGMRKGLDYYLSNDVSAQRTCSLMQKVAQRELRRLEGWQ